MENTTVKKKIKIALAEDHNAFRKQVKGLLESVDHFEVIYDASDGQEFISALDKIEFDIAVLDISMPKLDGLAVTDIIHMKKPELKVIILTGHNIPEYVEKVRKKGADALVFKDDLFNKLIPTIQGLYVS